MPAVSACGDDGEPDVDQIEITADSAADRAIGEDLHTYLERNFQPSEKEIEQLEDYCGAEPLTDVRERNCAQAELFLEHSPVVKEIDVENEVVTLHTNLPGDAESRAMAADWLCSLIQGADVADTVEGHTILDEDGGELAACKSR